MNLLKEAKKIKTHSIVGIVLLFTLFGIIVTLIFEIIDGIKILTLDWQDEELNNDKTLWGIFTIVLLGPIASLIFSIKAIKKLNNTTVLDGIVSENK